MLLVQLIGLPIRLFEGIAADIKPWLAEVSSRADVRIVPSSDARFAKYDDRLIGQAMANVQDGYVHIMAVNGRRTDLLVRPLKYDCRVVVVAIESHVHNTNWPAVRHALDAAIAYEERWCGALRPPDVHSALLLPPPCFELRRDLEDHWRASDCYHETEKLTVANNAMQAVRATHRRAGTRGLGFSRGPAYWQDAGERDYKLDLSRHGRDPAERAGRRKFRFCYEVPPGTHFDVTHPTRATFRLRDYRGEVHTVRRANADSWGVVRPA